MATKILADINEMAFTLACGNQPIAKDAKEVYFVDAEDKLPFGANNFGLTCNSVNDVFLAPDKDMLDNGEHLRLYLNSAIVFARRTAKVDEFKIDIKVQQAIQAAEALKQQLAVPTTLHFPQIWGAPFAPTEPLFILKAGWTPRKASFENFCKLCKKPETHNNNPADTLLLVENAAHQKFILGVSLKATFGKADITMYNGGVCAFYFIVIHGGDLANKKTHCPCTGKRSGSAPCMQEGLIKQPYTDWVDNLDIFQLPTTKKQKKAVWTKLVTNVIENDISDNRRTKALALTQQKLDALSGVRNIIWETMLNTWRGTASPSRKSFETTLSNGVARNIIGGLFQFTHTNIAKGKPDVPYVKSTSFLNYIGKFAKFKREMERAGYVDNPIVLATSISEKFETPDLTKYVPDGKSIEILIVKIAAVSILFCIKEGGKFIQHFTIRAKLESKPPSGIKIDIKPVAHTEYSPQKGGGHIKNRISCLTLDIEQKEILENIWDMTYPDCPWNDDLDEDLPSLAEQGNANAQEDDSFYASCHDDVVQAAGDEGGGGGGDEGGGGGGEVSVQNFFEKMHQIVVFYKESLALDTKQTQTDAAALSPRAGRALRYGRRTALKEMHANLDAILKKINGAIRSGCVAEEVKAAKAAENARLEGAEEWAAYGNDPKKVAKVKTADGGCSILGGGRRRRRRRKKTRHRRRRRTRHKKRRRRSRKKRHKKRTRRRHRRRH